MPREFIDIARPAAPPRASIHIPPSKSLTCRALVLAAIAAEPMEIRGALQGDDTLSLLQAIDDLGVGTRLEGDNMHVSGGGPGMPRRDPIDLGLGGAPARFTLALATLAEAPVVIDGAPPLRKRPMHDAVDLLQALGVRVSAAGDGSGLPLRVQPGPWTSHRIQVGATATSQVVSALLLVAPAAGGLEVEFTTPPTSASYLELTISSLRAAGVDVQCTRSDGALSTISVPAHLPRGGTCTIGADASSAAAAACLVCALPGSDVVLEGVRLDDGQPDAAALGLLAQAGVAIEAQDGSIRVAPGDSLHFPAVVDGGPMPDAIPSLAMLAATRGRGEVRFTGLHTLRVKECDRVAAVAHVLKALGGRVAVERDDLVISPMEPGAGGPVSLPTFDDHRMAMAGAVAGLWRGDVRIDDPDVVRKSWPTFWRDLAPLGGWEAA